MIVHSVLFGDNQNYERMARVLEYSIGVNSPLTPFVLHRVTEQDEDLVAAIDKRPHNRKPLYLNNARKQKHWNRIVQDTAEGEILGLIDTDAMVVGDLSPASAFRARWTDQYPEIVITHRPAGSNFPVNSGVVFVRICGYTKSFFAKWFDYSTRMLSDLSLHMQWKVRHGGINQAALAALEADYPGANILRVPCRIWNCETDCQQRELFSEQTKIVHIIGNLRKHLFNNDRASNATVKRLAGMWREYERQAMEVAA